METLVRLAILWLALFLLLFPYGALLSVGRVGPRVGILIGGAAGLFGGLVIFGPDYEPWAADVVTITVLTLLGAISVSSVAAAVHRWRPGSSNLRR